MKLVNEQRRFARKYKISIAETRRLWIRYGRKPKHYFPILSVGKDAKTIKGQKKGYRTGVCYLAPAKISGYNVCGKSNPFCESACLYNEGRARTIRNINVRRIAKTKKFFESHDVFMESAYHDTFRLLRKAAKENYTPCVRPNGTSDRPDMARKIAKRFPFLQVYDYTKLPEPEKRMLPNYDITFSYSGTNLAESLAALKRGINVSVVFAKELPKTWNGYTVINGDENDLRFLDPKGVVVGLIAKGISATKENVSPFIIMQ